MKFEGLEFSFKVTFSLPSPTWDLKIREQLGRLPELNLPTRACALELLSRVFAVVVSSRTAF